MIRRPPRSPLFPYTPLSRSGGMGGPQTRPFLVYPSELPAPAEPIIGAASVHEILAGWRQALQDERIPAPEQHIGATAKDRKSTRLNSSHLVISYAVFCLKKQ